MLTLIEKYQEGLRVFKCSCGQVVNIPKYQKEVKCFYCGEKKVDKSLDLLKCFEPNNRNYWIKPIKEFDNLTNAETGNLIYKGISKSN